MRKALIGIAVAAAMLLSGCAGGGSDGPTRASGGVEADWSKPLTVCRGVDAELLDTLVRPYSEGLEWQIDVSSGDTYGDALSSVGCTFSYGSSHRVEVSIAERSSSQDAAAVMSAMQDDECQSIGDVVFVTCAEPGEATQDSLESLSRLGPVLVTVQAYFWQEAIADRDEYEAKMAELHEDATRLAISFGIAAEDDPRGAEPAG
ncbi:hypothetical protein [Leucobacter sp. GX0328]